MPSPPFIGRKTELSALRREFDRDRASLIVVYGRRRVGKSTLLIEAIRDRPSVYFQAAQIATSENIALLKRSVSDVLGSNPVLDGLQNWTGILSWLAEATLERELTIVLDEFPYLCESEPALPSIVQKFWDALRRTSSRLNLVLCGSTISFMEELLAEKNPLHGRHSLKLDIGPMSLRDASGFFPGWSAQQRVVIYSIFGGIPYYLELCDADRTVQENLLDLVLSRGAPLAAEPNHILQSELNTVSRYATLLRAIADGCTTTGEIIGRLPEIENSGQLAPYVRKLEALRLIRIERSLDATPRERDRRYFVDDPFLAFWFRFCLPHLSALESGHAEHVLREKILPMLDDHIGGIFEWICRGYCRLHFQEVLGSPAEVVGRIWSSEFDLDVAGTLLDGRTFFGECKWRKKPTGVNVLEHLIHAADSTGFGSEASDRQFLVFSRSGFTPALTERASSAANLHLLTPWELVGTPA